MADPDEGRTPSGTIRTGVDRARVPADFEPVLSEVVARVGPGVSLYLYGSVATGQAIRGRSDVDLTAIGLAPDAARAVAAELSRRYAGLAREVAISPTSADDYGDGDAGYGNRVFLRHYSVWLAGPDPAADLPEFAADRAAARGFNGDLPRRRDAWRTALADPLPAGRLRALARGIGRKTLFAVAGLVSVHDWDWTTDRERAARRWSELHPELGEDLRRLLAWGDGLAPTGPAEVQRVVGDGVETVTAQFVEQIGAWRE